MLRFPVSAKYPIETQKTGGLIRSPVFLAAEPQRSQSFAANLLCVLRGSVAISLAGIQRCQYQHRGCKRQGIAVSGLALGTVSGQLQSPPAKDAGQLGAVFTGGVDVAQRVNNRQVAVDGLIDGGVIQGFAG